MIKKYRCENVLISLQDGKNISCEELYNYIYLVKRFIKCSYCKFVYNSYLSKEKNYIPKKYIIKKNGND